MHMAQLIYIVAMSVGLSCFSVNAAGVKSAQPHDLLFTNHPLVNRIYDVHRKQLIDASQLFERIADAGYILLGENHDNISHHRNQALVIEFLATTHRSVSVAFEMIDDNQYKFIKGSQFTTAHELIDLLNHFDTGWEYENYYKPVFDSVIRSGFIISPANIDSNRLMNIVMQESADVPAETARILSSTPLTPEIELEMQKDIIESHCDMLDAEQALPMVQAQRIRDATIAASLLNSKSDLRLLIAGNGHVRRDSGVPRYLLAQDRTAVIVTVGMFEVDEGRNDVSAYAQDWGGDGLPFDYVWFTARADKEDPCIEYIRQHEKR